MKSISQSYSQYFDRKYKRTGKIWENRYKLNMVEPEYECVIARYIERNPVRAGLVKKSEEYLYSSSRTNLRGDNDIILKKDIIDGRREEYREFFQERDADKEETFKDIREVVQQQKILGTEEFIRKIEEKFKMCFSVRQRGRPPINKN